MHRKLPYASLINYATSLLYKN